MYQVLYTPNALKSLKKIDPNTRKLLVQKLEYYLSFENPLIWAKKLTEFKLGNYRFRAGDYRITFSVTGKLIEICEFGHRKEIYK